MIYRLEISNFHSIRDPQVIDLTIPTNVSDPGGRFMPIFPGSELRAPKVVTLFGANASGKTTVLRALEFIVEFARNSAQRQGMLPGRFNDIASMSRPIELAVEFGYVMDLSPEVIERANAGEKIQYGACRYELRIEVEDGMPRRIGHEALRQRPDGKGKWQRVFERDGVGNVVGSTNNNAFPLTGYKHLLKTLRPDVSVLSSFALFEHPAAKLFHAALSKFAFTNAFSMEPVGEGAVVNALQNRPSTLAALNRQVRRIDVGVDEIRIVDGPNGLSAMFKHDGLDQSMGWLLQSHGTQAFVRLFPILDIILSEGGFAAVDELDVTIHPLVLPDILSWFYDETYNVHGSQLWFSCHSASLLEELTKEEIVLCEKDEGGRTRVFSLMDVKAVRRDDNLYRKYLSGVYGGIPSLG